MSFDYIRVDDILAIHADQIERYGGGEGIRDPGLLEAALFRPQTGYYRTLIEEAAALWESLSQNHPFVDGNKRTAFAATYVFWQSMDWISLRRMTKHKILFRALRNIEYNF